MSLNLMTRFILAGILLASLSACGSGSADSGQVVVQSDTANYIDKNKNGVKDADDVYDANHNNVDDATECLGGDADHNGRIEGSEIRHNDSDHDGIDDDKDDDYKGVKGQCNTEVNDDTHKNDDNGSDDDKRKSSKK